MLSFLGLSKLKSSGNNSGNLKSNSKAALEGHGSCAVDLDSDLSNQSLPSVKGKHAPISEIVSGIASKNSGNKRAGLKEVQNECHVVLENFCEQFSDRVDLGVIKILANNYYPQVNMLRRALDKYGVILSADNWESLIVPFRAALKVGSANNENLINVLDAFSQVAQRPMLLTDRNLPHTLEFIRGLVFHGWDVGASLMMLDDAANKQHDLNSTLRRCATATALMPTEKRQWWDRRDLAVSPLLELLSIDTLDDRLAQLGEDLIKYCSDRKIPAFSIMSQYCALCEVCRCLSDPSIPDVVERGVQHSIMRCDNPETVLRHLFIGISRRVDNVGVGRLVEKLSETRSPNEIRDLINQIRTTYNGDVLNEVTCVSTANASLAEKQRQIFSQSVADLRGLIDNSRCNLIYKGDLVDFPNGGLSLLARFGCEVGEAEKIFYAVDGVQTPGIKISSLKPEFLFSLDVEEQDWFNRYRSSRGWAKANIDHFLGAEIVFLPNIFAISVPAVKQFSFDNVPLSIVYFSPGRENVSGVSAVLVATEVLDQALSRSSYSVLDMPEHSRGLVNAAEIDLTPHGLAALAAHAGLPFFNVGAGTVVGGHSNAADLDLNETLEFARDYQKFGDQNRDGWGYVKKVALLENRDIFTPLATLHDSLHDIVHGFNAVSRIVSNRLAAWKRGITTTNRTYDVVDWMDQLPADKIGARMLFDAFKWHAELKGLGASREAFPKLCFWSLKDLKSGPLTDFYVDTFDNTFHFDGEVWPLPYSDDVGDPEASSEFAQKFCFSPSTMKLWTVEIQPRLAGLMPGFVFEG